MNQKTRERGIKIQGLYLVEPAVRHIFSQTLKLYTLFKDFHRCSQLETEILKREHCQDRKKSLWFLSPWKYLGSGDF